MKWLIPSLKTIAIVACADLPADAREMALAKIIVQIEDRPDIISHFGDASLQYEAQAASLSVKTQLQFSADDDIDISGPLAFICEDHSCRKWLVGALEAPFPKVKVTSETGASPKDRRRSTYTVTWPSKPVRALVWTASGTH